MITGIKLPLCPNMVGVTIEDVLSDLDILSEKFPESSFKNARDITITKRTYFGKKYLTTIIDYSQKDERSFDITYDLYKIVSEALPNFMSCFKYSEKKIIISYPNFSSQFFHMNDVYENLMNEIHRLTVFLMKLYGDDRETLIALIRDYVNLCVEFPNKD